MEQISGFALGLCILCLFLNSGRMIAGSLDPWGDFKSLEILDGEGFKKVAGPLVEVAANAYRYPSVIPIAGWTLVDAVDPIHGGMHAVVYKDDVNAERMIISFRGTDLSPTESSRADICADILLWGAVDESIFGPQNCSDFSNETLDYYKQAVDYTRKMLDAYPQASFLLTGHSLGAALAIMVSITFGSTPVLPVLAFSAPGTKTILERFSLELTSEQEKNTYIIADEWDEVMRKSWENQVGTLCLYQTNITDDCIACFTEPSEDSSNSCDSSSLQAEAFKEKFPETGVELETPCSSCFLATHYLKHLISVVQLGNRPVCESSRNIQTLSAF